MPTSLSVHVSVKKARANRVEREVRNTLRRYRRALKKDLEGTTDNWKDASDIPEFEATTSFKRGGDAVVEAGPVEDGSHGYDIWGYLNGGTSERWAVMSDDWVSKTAPGSLESGAGAGRVLIRGGMYKRLVEQGIMNGPMPGIEPRDWIGQLRERYRRRFYNDIRAAVRRGLTAK